MRTRFAMCSGFALLCCLMLGEAAFGSIEVLNAVNAKRIANGYRPFQYHQSLQEIADKKVREYAARGIIGHCGAAYGKTWEGTGFRGGVYDPHGRRFHSCFHFGTNPRAPTTRRGVYAGAAAYATSRGTYYILVFSEVAEIGPYKPGAYDRPVRNTVRRGFFRRR